MIKGTGTGVSTNIDGEFSIEAAAGDELIVSFIGYLTQTIKIDSQKRSISNYWKTLKHWKKLS